MGGEPLDELAVAGVALMVIPLLSITIGLFSHHITRPIETLAQANRLVQSGRRGYEIDQQPPNMEFGKLYDHFNGMSTELQHQFEQAYLEQQSAAEANANITGVTGPVQDTITREARADLFANIPKVMAGEMSARDAVQSSMALN